jgi:hypothetical protein
MTDGWNKDMDVLLVFVSSLQCAFGAATNHSLGWSLSAILTAFIIEFYKKLQPDTMATSAALLMNLAVALQCVANGSVCTELPVLPSPEFHPPGSAKWINGLWFTSLTLSLSVSAMTILAKQWSHAYSAGLSGQPRMYALVCQI